MLRCLGAWVPGAWGLQCLLAHHALPAHSSDDAYNARVLKLALDIANGMKYVAGLRILHIDLKVGAGSGSLSWNISSPCTSFTAENALLLSEGLPLI